MYYEQLGQMKTWLIHLLGDYTLTPLTWKKSIYFSANESIILPSSFLIGGDEVMLSLKKT